MARSSFIYLIKTVASARTIAAFTVKHEAHSWAAMSGWDWSDIELLRMRDGGHNGHGEGEKFTTYVPWDVDRQRELEEVYERSRKDHPKSDTTCGD